jgi:hypothetical protein
MFPRARIIANKLDISIRRVAKEVLNLLVGGPIGEGRASRLSNADHLREAG